MSARIRQIQIQNFKSIGHAVVDLGPFTALVGPNGAGKSNFMDALTFAQECVASGVDRALRNRGGIAGVRHRSPDRPRKIGLRFLLDLPGVSADYSFEIVANPDERLRVSRERCAVQSDSADRELFEIEDGEFVHGISGIRAKVEPDRLALFAASATPEFRPVFDFLADMRTYSIDPSVMLSEQDLVNGEYLNDDGSNAAAILHRLQSKAELADRSRRIDRLLAQVSSGIVGVEVHEVGDRGFLRFRERIGSETTTTFDAGSMSDGTLRVLGLLLALYQPSQPSLTGIEEPEAIVHPAAADLVIQTLLDAARRQQVLITTHSPDVLDYKELRNEHIRVVSKKDGSSLIAPLSPSNRQVLYDRLTTPGELLRIDEMRGDPEVVDDDRNFEPDLFGELILGPPTAAA